MGVRECVGTVQRRKDLGSHLYVKEGSSTKLQTPRDSRKGMLNRWVGSWVMSLGFPPAQATQGIKHKVGDFPESEKAELLPKRVEASLLGHL